MASRDTKRRYRILNIVGAALSALLVLSFVPVASGEESHFVPVGRLSLPVPEDGADLRYNSSLFVNSQARRAFNVTQAGGMTRIRLVDLEDLSVIGSIDTHYRFQLNAADEATATGWVHTIDEERNILYLAYDGGPAELGWGLLAVDGNALEAGAPDEEVIRPMSRLAATEPTAFVEVRPDPNDPATVCTADRCLPQVPHTHQARIFGLAIAPADLVGRTKILLLRQEGSIPQNEVVWVAQWDAETGRQDWIERVSTCSLGLAREGNYQSAIFQARLGPYIYLGCRGPGDLGFSVRLLVDENNRPQSEEAFAGPQNVIDVLGDPDSDRLLFRTRGDGEDWWVFNGPREAYSGVLSGTVTFRNTGAGMDPTSGRLYLLAPRNERGRTARDGGLLISDIRRDPAAQFLEFPQFSSFAGGPNMAGVPVDVHPETGERRVFVLPEGDRSTDCTPGGSCEYLVYRDDFPIAVDPPLEDLDRFTVDRDEEESVTGVNFTGTGHAYGMRVLFVGGLDGILGVDSGSPCGFQDREYSFGNVLRAALSNDLASGAASSANTDAGTKVDLEEPVERCYPNPTGSPLVENNWMRPQDLSGEQTNPVDQIAGQSWPFATVECGGDEKKAQENITLGDQELSGFTASAVCRQSDEEVRGSGRMSPTGGGVELPLGDDMVIRVAETGSETRLYRDPQRGLVSRSVAYARGISISETILDTTETGQGEEVAAEEIRIDAAIATAESWAAGRPGTASTFFARRLCGVRYPSEAIEEAVLQDVRGQVPPEVPAGIPPTGELDACGDPSIPVVSQQVAPELGTHPFIALLDRFLGTRGQARVPDPDFELAQGTMGGYLSSVQRDRLEELSNRIVNNDPSTQVPALEIVRFNDNPNRGRNRQVLQLAGVDASSTYGIFLRISDSIPDDFRDEDLPNLITEMTLPSSLRPQLTGNGVAALGGNGGGRNGNGGVLGGGVNPIRMIFEGLGFLLRSPTEAGLAALVWLLVFAPIHLALRRRALKEAMS